MAVRRAGARAGRKGGKTGTSQGQSSEDSVSAHDEIHRNTDEDADEDDNVDADSVANNESSQPQTEVDEGSDDPNAKNFNGSEERLRGCVDQLQKYRFACGTFVNDHRVQLFIVTLIAVNALMMGIATFDFVREDPDVSNAFEIVDQIFLVIFTVELGLQFVYHGWRLLLDGWLLFDLIVIVTSWSFSSVQIIRAFRIFRALRLITRIKTMKNLVLGKTPFVDVARVVVLILF